MPFGVADEVAPPIDTGNTTTTTGPTPIIPPYTGGQASDATVILAVGGAILIGVVLLIAWWYYRKNKVRIRLIDTIHFNVVKFILACKSVDMGAYNSRITIILLVWLGPMTAGILGGALIEPQWFGMAIMVGSMIFSSLIGVFGWRELQHKDIEQNQEKPWGTVEAWFPGHGWEQLTIRRMINKGKILLDDTQFNTLADYVCKTIAEGEDIKFAEIIKGMKDGAEVTLKEEDAKAVFRTALLARLKKMNYLRLEVLDNFWILLATEHEWDELLLEKATKQFDRMTDVEVKRAPMFWLYADESKRIFKTVSDEGAITITDRTMGVFINIFDRTTAEEMILTGRFVTMDIRDALIAKLVHAYEQECSSAEERDRDKRTIGEKKIESEEEKHKNDTSAKRDFNGLVAASDLIFGDPKTRMDQTVEAILYLLSSLSIILLILIATGNLVVV